jgi:restriction system protein
VNSQPKKLSALEAAYQVLLQAGEPLRCEEITRRMFAQNLWVTAGKTPDATVHARLCVDLKKKGTDSRFVRTGKATFGLNPTAATPRTPAPKPPRRQAARPRRADVQPTLLPPEPQQSTLSFTDAAERVLESQADARPMHYRELTERALDLGLLATKGRTPEATMYSQILSEIQRKTRRGEVPRFVKQGRGLFGLSRWTKTGLAHQIEQHNEHVRKELHKQLATMPPEEFERLIGRLLGDLNFEKVAVTPISKDGGIDVRGTLVVGDVIHTRMAVQVKRWKKNVQRQEVQQLRGSLGAHEQGLIITTSDFSPAAREEAARSDATPVALMNGEQLVGLLVENGIAVRRTSHELIEMGEEEDEA